jgi:hypothetical protein
MATATARKLFVILACSNDTIFPLAMQAATAALPWDRTLTATQDMLIGTVAPAAIGLAFSGAGILYTLGGYDIEAGRLFGSGVGGCVAPVIVHLLNYVLP